MSGFVKIYGEILTSTVWGEDLATRVLWVAMLALGDADGYVAGSVPGLARVANVTLEQCEHALARLAAPDPYSRTREHEGRRIEAVEGGWRILNARKYRDRRGPSGDRMAVHRSRHSVTGRDDVTAEAEAEAEAEADSLRSNENESRRTSTQTVSRTTVDQQPPSVDADGLEDRPAPSPLPESETPAPSKRKASRRKPPACSPEASRVLARLNEIRSGWVNGSALTNPAEIEGRLRDGYKVDDLLLVVEHKGHRAAMGPGPDRDYFDTISPFRRANFDGNLSRAQNEAARKPEPERPPATRSTRVTPEDEAATLERLQRMQGRRPQ